MPHVTQAVETPLRLSERMLALAAAISIDFDYFSRHSEDGSGGLLPFMMPMPIPPYPSSEGSPEGAEGSTADTTPPPGAAESPPGDEPSYSGEYLFSVASAGQLSTSSTKAMLHCGPRLYYRYHTT